MTWSLRVTVWIHQLTDSRVENLIRRRSRSGRSFDFAFGQNWFFLFLLPGSNVGLKTKFRQYFVNSIQAESFAHTP